MKKKKLKKYTLKQLLKLRDEVLVIHTLSRKELENIKATETSLKDIFPFLNEKS